MHTFQVKFSKAPVIVLVLVVLPLSVAALFMIPLLSLHHLPDWLVIAVPVVMLTVAIILTLTAIKRWVNIPAEVVLDTSGIKVRLLRRTPFYSRQSYSSTWSGLRNVSSNFNPQVQKRFYQVTFRDPSTTINLEPDEKTPGGIESSFGEILMEYVDGFNAAEATATGQPSRDHKDAIGHKGFYDSTWAKALTVFAYCAIAAAVIGDFADSTVVPVWRLIQISSFSIVWLAAYHSNRKTARK